MSRTSRRRTVISTSNPSSPATTTDKALRCTLQENNAIAISISTGANANSSTAAINYLGTISQRRIDAFRPKTLPTGGGLAAISINDVVPGLPTPDTIQTFVQGGKRYVATANEGDARTDDGDIARAGAAGIVDAVVDGAGDLVFAGSLKNSHRPWYASISRASTADTHADAGHRSAHDDRHAQLHNLGRSGQSGVRQRLDDRRLRPQQLTRSHSI